MKKALLILALPLLQLAAVQAFAADAVMPAPAKTRAEVKAEAVTAAKAGESIKPNNAAIAADKKAPVGDKTRMEVKVETKAAAKAGELPKTGEAAAARVVDKKPVSTKTRSEVKAAMKAPEGMPAKAGEEPKGVK